MASKNARYPKGFRASLFILVTPAIQAGGFRSLQEGQQVQFEVTKGPTSRTTGCRCVVEHCAGDEGAAFADQLTPASFASKQCQIKIS